ncbi:hypothetical protein CLOP_g16327 [Closterium sp. NIES-67]|nr:hypothetical protein CLOP_g16327 [Closterium sp. NIES-67]
MYAVSNREGGYNESLLMSIQPVTKTVAQVVVGVQRRRQKWEAEERLNDMLEATQHAMVAVAADGKLTCANRAARTLFGLDTVADGDGDATGGKLPPGLKLADVLVSIDGDDGLHAARPGSLCRGVTPRAAGRGAAAQVAGRGGRRCR